MEEIKIARKYHPLLILLAVLAIAVFFRFWQIDVIPPGLYPGEAINGNDALASLEKNDFKIFYPDNNGREGLFVWLIALSFKIFGPAAWSLRIVSAFFGAFTVLGIYLLAKEIMKLWNKHHPYSIKTQMIPILASFFLAVSFWHTNFSRIGFRAIMVPFLLCFSFYFLFRGFRTNKFFNYVWAGIFFGLGFYTYIAFRMAVLLLAIVLLIKAIYYWQNNRPRKITWSWLFEKTYLKAGWWQVDVFLAIIIILALPIGVYFLQNPQDFLGKASGVSVLGAEEPLKKLGESSLKALGMFHFVGDGNWRHNYAGDPQLAWSTGALFALGLILSIISLCRFFTSWRKQMGKIRWDELLAPLFLLSWFGIMLLPSILTAEDLPYALRSVGVIPAVYIFAAVGLFWLFEKMRQLDKKIAPFIIVLLLIHPAVTNYHKYFYEWGENAHTRKAFRQDLIGLANSLSELPKETKKYVIANEEDVMVEYERDGLPMPVQTIIFQAKAKDTEINYLVEDENGQLKIKAPSLAIVSLKETEGIFDQFKKHWPGGEITKINGFQAFQFQVNR